MSVIDIFSDYHIHTPLCHHATGSMEEYVQAAIKKGLRKICFLEHMEEGINAKKTTWLTEKDFDIYFSKGKLLQKKYHTQIEILLGVEVGYNPERVAILQDRLAARTWDWIGLSYHFHRYQEDSYHYNLVSKRDQRVLALNTAEAEAILAAYYNSLSDAVDYIPCNMVCHLDAALRYHSGHPSFSQPWKEIKYLLKKLQDKNIALEVNTSGIAIRNEVFPGKEILYQAILHKIPLVASSDSHSPGTVGAYFSRLPDIVNEAKNCHN